MENQPILYIAIASIIIAVICCIIAIYALSSIKKAKKELKENEIKFAKEIKNEISEGNKEEKAEEKNSLRPYVPEIKESNVVEKEIETKAVNEVQGIDPQIIAVISAAVMCMGGGKILSIKRTDNAGWKRAARLAGMSNRVY